MPSPRRALTEEDVRQFVEERCFLPGGGRVGAELEWFVTGEVDHTDIEAAAGGRPFAGTSTLSFEPGGQVELSSPVAEDVAGVCAILEADAAELRRRLAPVGAGLLAAGVHPDRRPRRVLQSPRYEAMEMYWSSGGEHEPGAGLAMMSTTAAVQVSLDASVEGAGPEHSGDPGTRDSRWRLSHALSPVLAACFANSPVVQGRPTGWRSSRLALWEGLDRTRTSPALRTGRAVDDWTAYLLDANVMLMRDGDAYHPVTCPFPFGRWMNEGHPLGWPGADDLVYHLSTLFPPVRAKGWLELRWMDALPEPWWPVPIAVTAALLNDPEAADGAARSCGRASWCWCEAPRWSLSYEPLAEAAQRCFRLAADALPRLGAPDGLLAVVESYRERFVDRGRCPADDTLDAMSSVSAP